MTLPVEPLAELVETAPSVRGLLGDESSARAYYRALDVGTLTMDAADQLADAIGRHPANIWPDYYEHVDDLDLDLDRLCRVLSCSRMNHARGWCIVHYQRWRRHGDPQVNPGRGNWGDDRRCDVDGCNREHYGRGWCNMHWSRWRRHGDPLHVDDYGPDPVHEGCRVEGCDERHHARGLCRLHYQRWWYGDERLDAIAAKPVSTQG